MLRNLEEYIHEIFPGMLSQKVVRGVYFYSDICVWIPQQAGLKARTHNVTFYAVLRATIFFVSVIRCSVAEVELDFTSATVACNVARKVVSRP